MNRSRFAGRLVAVLTLAFAVVSCAPDAPTTPPSPSAAVAGALAGAQANAGGVTIAAPASARLHPGDKLQLTATVVLPNGSEKDKFPIKWSTSNPAVATVDEKTGEVTAVAPGAVTITAKAGPRTGQMALTVMIAVARVTISPSSTTLPWNTQVPATWAPTVMAFDANGAALSDLAGRTIVWASDDTTTATVAPLSGSPSEGLVTAVRMGKTTISATVDGVRGTAQVTVEPTAGFMNDGNGPGTLVVGETTAFRMTFVTANFQPVRINEADPQSWVSTNQAVATVTQVGVVTLLAPGTTAIQGTYRGFTVSANVTVVSAASPGPNAPSGLKIGFTAVESSTYQLSIGWDDNSNNEDEFQVERAVGAGNFVLVGTVPGFNGPGSGVGGGGFNDPETTTENTLYTFRVRACNAVGCSAYSSPISMPGPLAPPTILSATRDNAGGVELTWQANTTRAGSYAVLTERVDANGDFAVLSRQEVPANTTDFNAPGAAPGTTVVYFVMPCANVPGYGNFCSTAAISQRFTF